jgi:hypothetical protein
LPTIEEYFPNYPNYGPLYYYVGGYHNSAYYNNAYYNIGGYYNSGSPYMVNYYTP